MLILINIDILDMEPNLIDMDFFSHSSGRTGKNVIIFGEDMTSSTKTDNRKKDISILGKSPTQGLDPTVSAGKMYSIDFTENNKKFCLGLFEFIC